MTFLPTGSLTPATASGSPTTAVVNPMLYFIPAAGGHTGARPHVLRSELNLASVGDSVSRARRHAADVLRAWGADDDTVDAARLIVSELATNAVCHADPDGKGTCAPAGGPTDVFGVSLQAVGDAVVISVTDGDPSPPHVTVADERADSGRGMYIVAMASTRWGHHPARSGPGKTVWAELPLIRAATSGTSQEIG
ncbi:ATP-binding protein [Streptomyces sp. NPDC051320]|uniref:ATP-binding protein n=1 Tax=Streptomyces sp. NPDC051320 TaxID=3154644 RepID=UPI003429F80F